MNKKLVHFFQRDGTERNINTPIVEFLKPHPTSSELYNRYEENQYTFFKELGKNFSDYPLFNPHYDPEFSTYILSNYIENRCHDTAVSIFIPNEFTFDLVFGFFDSYINNQYIGTFSHSFLIEKDGSAIIDPLLIEHVRVGRGPLVSHWNHFGVVIPAMALYELSFTAMNEDLKYDDLGVIPSYIFTDSILTQNFINQIRRFSY